ncbi:thioesterase family protein [Ruminococcaceae bacterium OttesenSCG-928-D13]|nr:thioesterase family protein [Ruminococcaceae bacterium OttesenSCG-928-D13]
MELNKGTAVTLEVTVDETNLASAVGSGLLDVFATPAMIAQMESAAAQCMAQGLTEGQASVGTRIEVEHLAATPLGLVVTVTATVVAVDGRRVDFSLEAGDKTGVVGRGTHSRFVVDVDRFMAKALQKQG